MKNRKKKGFTLVELIVVIAILGILAMIAVPRLAGFRETAQISADQRTIETVEKSINLAIASGRIIPAASGTVTATIAADGTVTWSSANITFNPSGDDIGDVMDDLVGTGVRFQSEASTTEIFQINAAGVVTPPTI